MSSPGHWSKLRLRVRLLVAVLLLAVIAAVMVGVETVLFGLTTVPPLWLMSALTTALYGEAAGLVIAVVAYAVLLLVTVASHRLTQESELGALAVPESLSYLHIYAYIGPVVASVVVIDLLFGWFGTPMWVFLVLLVTGIAMFYPMCFYALTRMTADGDDEPPWRGEVDPAEEPPRREQFALVWRRVRRLTGELAAWAGPVGTVLTAVAALGGLAAVYLLGTTWTGPSELLVSALTGTDALTGDVLLGLARWASGALVVATVGVTLLAVAVHVGHIVRTELGDAAVLRELDEGLEDADDPATLADLDERVTRLATLADLPAPDVRLVSSAAPTAAAVGYRPSSSTIVASTELVESLDDPELDAVLAHELAHVANRDAAVLTAASFPRVAANRAFERYWVNPVMIGYVVVIAAAGRLCAAMAARTREYVADDAAAAMTGDPAALATALETLDRTADSRSQRDLRSLAAFTIVPPPWEERRFFDRTYRLVYRGLLGTHPPTERRVERLRRQVRESELGS